MPYEKKVVSAHRTPDLMFEYAETARTRGIQVIIAGAGGAAHLPGMVAAKTTLPVIGVPVQSKALNGYGFCDATGRVDALDTYVLLRGNEKSSYRQANYAFGGGYFSFVKHSKLDAVSGRFNTLYGGTYGTTVDEGVANDLNLKAKYLAGTEKSTWNSELELDEYEVRQEMDETIWNYEPHEPGWTNNELQEYTTSTDNVFVKDGKLVIEGEGDNYDPEAFE